MSDERQEQRRSSEARTGRPAETKQASDHERHERRGPFTFTAGWLGTTFDRSRVNKQEAEERRSRNM